MPEQRASPPRHQPLVFPMAALCVGTVIVAGIVWGAIEMFGSFSLPFRS